MILLPGPGFPVRGQGSIEGPVPAPATATPMAVHGGLDHSRNADMHQGYCTPALLDSLQLPRTHPDIEGGAEAFRHDGEKRRRVCSKITRGS
jgi:hypothetical protein